MYTYTIILAIMALISLIILIGYICITTKLICEQIKDRKDVSSDIFALFTFLIILATIILFINY